MSIRVNPDGCRHFFANQCQSARIRVGRRPFRKTNDTIISGVFYYPNLCLPSQSPILEPQSGGRVQTGDTPEARRGFYPWQVQSSREECTTASASPANPGRQRPGAQKPPPTGRPSKPPVVAPHQLKPTKPLPQYPTLDLCSIRWRDNRGQVIKHWTTKAQDRTLWRDCWVPRS
ncbi:hypothetical protein WR25_13347 [Diploscapter pachys]|uniref:Uncharacterized protein n=1 Tax=Diploscapter pachys TaxID=2018661 RepID=A0A2A2JHA2_9BILA|nr:hypothetical protein WR25_13347 [Diploscapter pachys]